MPNLPGVRMSSAPRALRSWRLSILILSGMVRISLRPYARATKAKPMPVLPEVGSIKVEPGLMIPRFKKSLTMYKAARSLTDPAGLNISNLRRMSALRFKWAFRRLRRTNGVLPMSSMTEL